MAIKSNMIVAKLDDDLKNAFMSIAESKHRSASQILRDLIRVYVESNKIPNDTTLKAFKNTDEGTNIHYAKNAADLFKQLDI